MKKTFVNSVIFMLFGIAAMAANPRTTISNMRTEYLANPIGLDASAPRFTWNIVSDGEFDQSKYQISVATSPELLKQGKADVWVSPVVGSESALAIYAGDKPLQSYAKYYWSVQAWSKKGKRITSPAASFEMAKMSGDDWKGKWISDNFDKEFRKAPMLRKSFSLDKKIAKARAYVCGAGYYEMFINGRKVGDHSLDPGYTHFDKRVLYVTHDITDHLKNGDNAVAAVLGNGWFNIQSLSVWQFHTARWRMRPRLLCDIKIDYTDGTTQTISTDDTWMANTGPYIYNNLYSGDTYDARLEKNGWTEAGYDDKSWWKAKEVDAPTKLIVAQQMPPMRIVREVKPVSMKTFDENTYVYDMGENMTGVCRLKIKGKAGTVVTIKHGELAFPDGTLNQGNIDVYFQREQNSMPQHKDPNDIFQTDTYYLKGSTEETFIPLFTYHGFQYVEVQSSKPIEISQQSLTGLVIHTDVESVGSFSCSNEVLNKIVEASRRSYLSNLHSIPTDCPQREKNGWTADGYISMDLGLLNFDGVTVYEKWLNDFVDNQRERGDISGIIPSAGWGYADWIGPVWDAGLFIIAQKLYLYHGDKRAIENVYPTCEKYLEYLKTREQDGMLTYGIGDWVFYKAKTPTDYTSTAFYWLDNTIMAQFATLMGKDASPYIAKADALKELINKRWFDAQSGLYANGTQAAQAVALALGLVPQGSEQKVADKLAEMIRSNNHQLDFGMLGSKFVPAMLVKYGYAEDAYKMVVRKDAPSWANWIEKGLTTLPETWVLAEDFRDASLNHVFLGDISAWMVNTIAGINYDEQNPGFKHIILRPHFLKDLTWAKGEYISTNGLIRSEWKREAGKVKLTVTVPANTTATLYLDKEIQLKSGVHNFTVNQ